MRKYALILPLTAALLLSGCAELGSFGPSDAFKEDFHSTHPLNPGGTLSVESFNGPIELIGWEQNSVEVNGTKSASTQSGLDSIKIDVDSSPGSLRVRATRSSDTHWHMGARFTLRVPRKILLDLISTSNGHIRVEDIDGKARLRTSNGGIRISRFKGELEAKTSNGPIEVDSIDGNANLHTSNGAIRAEASHGSFEAVTSNGSIHARLNDPSANASVRVQSSNGQIELTLDTRQLPEVRASTNNSSIVLRLRAFANAQVRASTSHASVSSDFSELRSEGSRDRRHSDLNGTIGSGGPLLDLTSSNGSIKILKM